MEESRNEKPEKTATGYRRITSVYECGECRGCPYKTQCIKGNNSKTPMEDRMKRLYVSKTMKQKRTEDLERITSDYGTRAFCHKRKVWFRAPFPLKQ